MGYTCYFVVGYYLKNFTIGRVAEAVIYVLGIGGAAATVLGTAVLSRRAGHFDATLCSYTSVSVALMSAAVFVLFRYVLGISDERGRSRGVGTVARASFGIYLVHDFFIMLLRQLGAFSLPIPMALAIPLWAAVVFLPSFAVAWLLGRIPFVGRYLA